MKIRSKTRENNFHVIIIVEDIEETFMASSDIWIRIKAIINAHKALIITRSMRIQKLVYPVPCILLPGGNERGGSAAFLFSCLLLLPFIRCNIIYIAEISACPVTLLVRRKKKKIICYGNTHPSQYGEIRLRGFKGKIAKFIYLSLYRIAIRKIDRIFAISNYLRDFYCSLGATSVIVLPIGVDLSLFGQVTRQRDDTFRCIYIGSLTPARGEREILQAAQIVSRELPCFKLRFVGISEGKKQQLISQAKVLGIEQILEIFPPVNHLEIPGHLRSADVGLSFLYPTPYYLFSPPTKVFEYLAAGIPVIANSIRTHTDYIIHEYNGLITDLDPDHISAAILRLAKDKSLYDKLASNCRKSAASFDQEIIMRQFLKNFS